MDCPESERDKTQLALDELESGAAGFQPAADVLRVLNVIARMDRGGAETRLMEFLRHVDRRRVHFAFAVTKSHPGSYDPEIRSLGAQIMRPASAKILPRFVWRLYRLLKASPWDVMDCHLLLFSGICVTVAKWAGVAKRVAHMHSTADGKETTILRRMYRRCMTDLLLRNATDVVGVSCAVVASWFGPHWRRHSKIRVVYNGIETTPFRRTPTPTWLNGEFDIPPNFRTVLHVGNFRQAKNHAKVVDIAAGYLKEEPDTCFILVGEGPLSAQIQGLVRLHGIRDKFRFAGRRDDVPQMMMSANAFLLPSLWEGFPRVILEALAAGLPVVASDLPATREVAARFDDVTLVTVDASDHVWVATLQDAVRTPRQTHNLEKLDNSEFSVARSWENILAIYRD